MGLERFSNEDPEFIHPVIAQLIKRRSEEPGVVGSTPIGGTMVP